MEYDALYKLVAIGNAMTGKSNFILRFVDDTFCPNYIPTLSNDFKSYQLTLNDKDLKLQIWDTVGQELSVPSSLYEGSNGFLLFYSIDSRESFDSLSRWHGEASEAIQSGAKVIVIGMKSDLDHGGREVLASEGQAFAHGIGALFIEASALTNSNISAALLNLLLAIGKGS
mmetsp:Transcript_33263/g.58368  ORF Transcript_33263/g.58368 Transcript_33263/m.58368 type:complete len:171 (+) Transcript_33263:34-546(+)